MSGGWFCIWRKIEDNISWSRGIEYRGLMITILQKANWKKGFFLGHEIMPGQFPTSAENLAKDLKISRQKCQRALSQLSNDNFINVKNVSNRFTLITVINWEAYQDIKEVSEQQVSNHRATGEQQVGTIEQGNKETREQKDPPLDVKEPNKKPANKSKIQVEYPSWLNMELFNEFIEDRKERKKPATSRAISSLITKLEKSCEGNHKLQDLIIQKSIDRSWISFFPLDEKDKPVKEEYLGPTCEFLPGVMEELAADCERIREQKKKEDENELHK